MKVASVVKSRSSSQRGTLLEQQGQPCQCNVGTSACKTWRTVRWRTASIWKRRDGPCWTVIEESGLSTSDSSVSGPSRDASAVSTGYHSKDWVFVPREHGNMEPPPPWLTAQRGFVFGCRWLHAFSSWLITFNFKWRIFFFCNSVVVPTVRIAK